jgi:hypothetical protein
MISRTPRKLRFLIFLRKALLPALSSFRTLTAGQNPPITLAVDPNHHQQQPVAGLAAKLPLSTMPSMINIRVFASIGRLCQPSIVPQLFCSRSDIVDGETHVLTTLP